MRTIVFIPKPATKKTIFRDILRKHYETLPKKNEGRRQLKSSADFSQVEINF